ncbi:MAG: FecR family protein [Paracoccaceae bacterium]
MMQINRVIAATLLLFVAVVQAGAQVPENCSIEERADPARHVLRCQGGLVIEIGASTGLGYVEQTDGTLARVTVKQGAVMVDVTPGGAAPQIRTPHAIAAVRGTVYAIEVGDASTAVFVVRGEVDVRHVRGRRSSVVLGAGQGVDAVPGQPLEVKAWNEPRVRKLLARFGR